MPDPLSIQAESLDLQDKPLFLPSRIITDITLICTVRLRPTVNVPVTVEAMWYGPDGQFIMTTNADMDAINIYTSMVTISSMSIMDAGMYRCCATVRAPSPANMSIIGVGTNENSTNIALCEFIKDAKLM